MLGTLRLLLALAVAASHAGLRWWGLNPGVMAVVVFYLVSGYLMTQLLHNYYPGRSGVLPFYRDRVMRLAPQYFVLVALTLIWWLASGKRTDFLQHSPGALELLNNVLVVPLNYYMFNQADQWTLIPPAWSLGAELQFYLCMPLLLVLRSRAAAFVLALAVFLCAAFGAINSEIWGYRLLPGVLLFFMLGSALADSHRTPGSRRGWLLVLGSIAGAAVLALALQQFGKLGLPYTKETLIGLVFGITALHLLAPQRRQAVDEHLGELSYGVFLNHFLLLWLGLGPQGPAGWAGFIALSCVLAWLTWRVAERPVMTWRRRLRRATAPRQDHPAPPAAAPGGG